MAGTARAREHAVKPSAHKATAPAKALTVTRNVAAHAPRRLPTPQVAHAILMTHAQPAAKAREQAPDHPSPRSSKSPAAHADPSKHDGAAEKQAKTGDVPKAQQAAKSHDAGRTTAVDTPAARPGPIAKGSGAALGPREAPENGAPAAQQAAAPSPRAAIAPAVVAVRQRAGVARSHAPAKAAVAAAQASAVQPPIEQARGAAVQTVGTLDAAKAEAVRRDAFKTKLKKAIVDATPPPATEDDAKKVMHEGGAKASGALRGELTTERDVAAGPMKSAATNEASASDQPAPATATLEVQPPGAPPAPVSAGPLVPAALPPQRLDYSADHAPTETVMAQNQVTPEQLRKGNDPAFTPTLDARAAAEKHEAAAQGAYRGQEAKDQAAAQAGGEAALAEGLGGMHASRVAQLTGVGDKQHGAAAQDAAQRQQITAEITAIKDKTKVAVEKVLGEMDAQASQIFDLGLQRAEAAYDSAFSEAKGGWGTWLTTWGSDWDKHIAAALATARAEYMRQVDSAIDEVAVFVDAKIREAKECVTAGHKEIDAKVAGLAGSLQEVGAQARDAVSGDFDAMGSMIDERRDALVDKLAQQYKESYERMSAHEEELREANKSLWQRAYDATVGLIKKIIAFKDMLLGLLSRAAGVVNDIIADPIGFLGNLVTGVMAGLRAFISNIGSHLKKGLMDWLFGALAGAGLTLPDTFDLKGIVSIVLQVMGLTYANFRARAVAIIGEPIVAGLEQAAEVFKIVMTEGIGGLWRFIKEKVADLKSMVLDAIFDFIKEKVIVAGITWIIGLLNPASAFFKACKAIYDIVMFFINRGSQILSLVNAIVDSMAAIVKGNTAVAATFVENALAKAVPVAIGFLAGLLGLGDPSKPVKATMEKAQSPVNKAMDWVIHQAVKLVKAAGKFVKGLFGKDDKEDHKTAKGEAGHVAIAQEVGAALLAVDVSSKTAQEAQPELRKTATQLEMQHSPRLEPGIKLRIEVSQPKEAREEIDFEVVIAPNTTKRKYVTHIQGFPGPEVGTYAELIAKGSKELPDKKIREAHHAPPVELANSLGAALVEAGEELSQTYGDQAIPLLAAGGELLAAGDAHGPELSAILVHQDTHRTRGGAGHRIHGSEIRKPLTSSLAKQHEKDAPRTAAGDITVKAGSAAFDRQIRQVADDSGPGKKATQPKPLSEALRLHGKEIVTRVYDAEEARSMLAVEIALSKSKVDGDEKERRSALAKLKAMARKTWHALIAAIKYS